MLIPSSYFIPPTKRFSFWLTKQDTTKSDSEIKERGFPGGAVVKNLPANAGDTGSSPAPGRSHIPRSN